MPKIWKDEVKGFEANCTTNDTGHLSNIETVASLGIQAGVDDYWEPISEKAASWGERLASSIGIDKIAEVYIAEKKKKDDNKALKVALGTAALGAGLFLGLRGHNNIIKAKNSALRAETEPMRDLGKYLVNRVGDARNANKAFFESNFSNIRDPYKKNIIMKTTQDIEGWINEAGRTIRIPEEKADVHRKIQDILSQIEERDVSGDYIGAVDYLRSKASNTLDRAKSK